MRRVSAPDATDFVIVARIECLTAPFARLSSDLERALGKAAARRQDAAAGNDKRPA